MDAETGGAWAAAGAAATAITGAIVRLIGSKKERDNDRSQATEEWRELAREARAERQACEERQQMLAAEVNDLRSTVVDLTLEHGQCPSRIESLERQVRELQRRSDPPEGA